MNLALNNATNVAQYYQERGEKVEIEIVTFGPGLNMLRDDTSPVKARIKAIAASTPGISFKACGNTQGNMSKAENKDISLVPEAVVVKSGLPEGTPLPGSPVSFGNRRLPVRLPLGLSKDEFEERLHQRLHTARLGRHCTRGSQGGAIKTRRSGCLKTQRSGLAYRASARRATWRSLRQRTTIEPEKSLLGSGGMDHRKERIRSCP
jgi:intracellular sulfur oxidation DsrE/DsrF family protein